MSNRIKVTDIELSRPLESITNLEGYQFLRGLVKLHGSPIGYIQLPVKRGECSGHAIAQEIFPQFAEAIGRQLINYRLAVPDSSWQIADLLKLTPVAIQNLPSVTVAFCPRRSTELDLTDCLQALQKLEYPNLEILIVENAPQSDALQKIVQQNYPTFHHLYTDKVGLNQARNLAIGKARNEIIAFTDEQGIVDTNWIGAIATSFAQNPQVMALTGLVIPDQIETENQALFEFWYGLGRGCDRRWNSSLKSWSDLGTMQLGSGVNMSYRRRLFEQIGMFDLALDRDTLTEGGGDWEMFCRILIAGQTLLYEPNAIVRYRSPEYDQAMRSFLTRNLTSFYAYIYTGIAAYPKLRLSFLCLALWKFARLCISWLRPYNLPRDFIIAEFQGVWRSWQGYQQARQTAPIHKVVSIEPTPKLMTTQAIDLSDLPDLLPDLLDITGYQATRIFVTEGSTFIGSVDIKNQVAPISAAQLRDAIAHQLTFDLLSLPHQRNRETARKALDFLLTQHWTPIAKPTTPQPSLSDQIPVSIIITTCDRPTDLLNCLHHLTAQKTTRSIEIIVADNRPDSGLTPPIVAQFPQVKLVQETRKGGAYGRNAAIVASTSEIIVTVDDDVTVPPDWLEKLIAPMARPDVMVVTGNVLPLELETPAQRMFEKLKNGLSAGFLPLEVDGNWLASFEYSPPVWELGVSANSAMRTSIFSHPQIGLMEETLGPGTPAAGAEETYLYYKVLKAGYTLVYAPEAYVWHRHRRELSAFYRQIYGQMKSCTAYHLHLWLNEKDSRGLRQLVNVMPRYFVWRIVDRLQRKHDTPWLYLWQEISGLIAGSWGYWQSCQLVKRNGRSQPYIPVIERTESLQNQSYVSQK
ncbi:glycosyltransferase [Phormidesmis sp. 146-35]